MKEGHNDGRARLIAMVSRNEMDFIDRIGKDALYSTGKRLSRADIVSAVLEAVARLPISGKNIRSEEELRDCILRSIKSDCRQRRQDSSLSIKPNYPKG